MPFTKLKEVLGAKADALGATGGGPGVVGLGVGGGTGMAVAGQVVQRWGVAKRLLKMERGGGQQVVRFNV